MWIRTQDKETLLNVNCIDMYNLNKYEWIIEACGNDLGTYKSKERALEVLDEIQKKINDIKKDFLMACMREKGVYDVIAWNDFVYQMPEE